MGKVYDVIIAGGGPVGLFLACELGFRGTSVLILESNPKSESPWKIKPLGRRGLNTPSVEVFYQRGLLDKLFDGEDRPSTIWKTPGFQFSGHFGGIMLNANKLELDRWKYRLPGPALTPGLTTIKKIEAVLIERAESLGVAILRDKAVTQIVAQSEIGITVKTSDDASYSSRWLVGCDGGQSRVRKAAHFDFVGTEARFTGYAIKCDFNHPEKLRPGFHVTKTGMYIVAGTDCLHLVDFDGAIFDRRQEITKEHVQDVMNRMTGITGLKITTVHLVSSYTDRSKQATSYRKGRILLAGDVAHIHSPLGAQGLNVGLGDAMNLGWKLATTIRQEAVSIKDPVDLTLLDTCENERHPIGAWVLEWTRAQVATLQPDLCGAAIQTLIRDLVDTPDGTNLFLDRIWGLSQRYILGKGDSYTDSLVGASAPDFELADGSRLGLKLQSGRGLLVDFENNATLHESIDDKYTNTIDIINVGAMIKCGLRALLVRPDGVVAWILEDDDTFSINEFNNALKKWFKE
ncbi:hypothetical protein BCON_0009g00010 [Botryotinia convoluta]|uniref:FAD-binding domain-containing protein n=1 Tax=Botryotinia convoluta TaxID=54673 RepID=A0A4Z1IWQ7_9HELO|nr:hypothetical protein BCON_0009g00010 [Botryotinia convoluta]